MCEDSPHGSAQSMDNMRKHRNEVFFPLTGLSEKDYLDLPDSIASDVLVFRDNLPKQSPDWIGNPKPPSDQTENFSKS